VAFRDWVVGDSNHFCIEFRQSAISSFDQVLDIFAARRIVTVNCEAAFSPPNASSPVLILLLPYCHLPVRIQ
jgi:hypothetical protein